MDSDQVTDLVRQALLVSMEVSAPLLILAMVIGFLISIFQSVTQINELTLSFVPKMFAFAVALMVFFPWMLKIMVKYTNDLLLFQWEKIVSLASYTT